MYEKLSEKSKLFAKSNNFLTDDQLTKFQKELRITMRLDYDVKREVYSKWTLSELIEAYIDNSSNDKIGIYN